MSKKETTQNKFETLMHNGHQPEVDVGYCILPRFLAYLSDDHKSIELIHNDGYRVLRDPPISAIIRDDGSYTVNCYISLPSQLYTCERRLVEWLTEGKYSLRRLKRAAAHGLWFEPLDGTDVPTGQRIITGGLVSFSPKHEIITYNEPLNRIVDEEAATMIRDLIEKVRTDAILRARLTALDGKDKGTPLAYWASGKEILTLLKKVRTNNIDSFKPLASVARHRYGTRYDYVTGSHVNLPLDQAVHKYLLFAQKKILHDTGAIKYA